MFAFCVAVFIAIVLSAICASNVLSKSKNVSPPPHIKLIDPKHGCHVSSSPPTTPRSPIKRTNDIASTSSLFLVRSPPFLQERGLFGFDIGGSLAKICLYEPTIDKGLSQSNLKKINFLLSGLRYGDSGVRDPCLSFEWHGGTFHFIHFETRFMDKAIDLFEENALFEPGEPFLATGGGAFKFSERLRERLGAKVSRADELHSLLRGLNFLLEHVPDECYYLSKPDVLDYSIQDHVPLNLTQRENVYPYLLVNIGSGVSIIQVTGPASWVRVSGTCLGGGTYWGLCRLLVEDSLSYENAFELAKVGDPRKCNMTVSDIYGGGYKNFGLPGDLVASAFGKMVSKERPRSDVKTGDIARALLDMIAMNVAQLAYLNADSLGIKRIIFAGSFLRQNELSSMSLSYSINYWSKESIRACFLKHEGYCGSLGVFLCPEDSLEKA